MKILPEVHRGPEPWSLGAEEKEGTEPCFEVFTPPHVGFHFGSDFCQWLCSTQTH